MEITLKKELINGKKVNKFSFYLSNQFDYKWVIFMYEKRLYGDGDLFKFNTFD